MTTNQPHKLIIAISSRALFDLDDCNTIYEQEGIAAYAKHQIANEDSILKPGVAFNLVKKLLARNIETDLVEVILLSRNSPDTGLRIFNSIEHYGLNITRAAFTSGESPYRYIKAFNATLFLSSNPEDVQNALCNHCAAATILQKPNNTMDDGILRIAFDGDAVLFSDEAERVFQEHGLEKFTEHEVNAAEQPLSEGPFKGFLQALHQIQQSFNPEHCPIRTALVTARQAPTHKRVIKTLRAWDIRIDEAIFLGGLTKTAFLKSFAADIFFDDQQGHCDKAKSEVATGHVPHGVRNQGQS